MENLCKPAGSRRIPRAKRASRHDVGSNAARKGHGASCVYILIVEDEAAYGRSLLRTTTRCGGTATLVGTVQEAREQLASGASWAGLIVDVPLPDGLGLDLLGEARAKGLDVPALITSGLRDNAVAHAAFGLGALYLVKPVDDVYIESFLRQASLQSASVHTGSRIQSVIANWTTRFGLSEAERSILLLSAEGYDRAAIATIRGTSEATVKNQICSLFHKTGDLCLLEAVVRMLRETLGT